MIDYAFNFFTRILYTVHVSALYKKRKLLCTPCISPLGTHDGCPTAFLTASHKLHSLPHPKGELTIKSGIVCDGTF